MKNLFFFSAVVEEAEATLSFAKRIVGMVRIVLNIVICSFDCDFCVFSKSYATAEECHDIGLPVNKGTWDLVRLSRTVVFASRFNQTQYNCRVSEEVHAQPLLYLDGDDFRLELAAESKAEAHTWATRIAAGSSIGGSCQCRSRKCFRGVESNRY